MRWTAAQLPDLDRHTAVVTGANSGIGWHTARALAAHGARVVLACRRPEAGQAAAERLRRSHPSGEISSAELDLSSVASVRSFAEGWEGPLDLLVNNAGVMAPPKRASTADGYELQFGTNHLGHFVLTGLLLPALRASAFGARVVSVSSIAHKGGDETVLDANAGGYQPQKTYANSKLANLLFALELHRELTAHGSSVVSTAAHPGVSATGLFVDRQGMGSNPFVRALLPLALRVATASPATGARSVLYAATAAEPGSYTGPRRFGETRGAIGPASMSSFAQDAKLGRRLWHVSEALTGLRYRWD